MNAPKQLQSKSISRATVVDSFPVAEVLPRYAALLRPCDLRSDETPYIYTTPASLFDNAMNASDKRGADDLDALDRQFLDSKTCAALVGRTETRVALHYAFGHGVLFTPVLGEVARLLATILPIAELERMYQRVYVSTHIVEVGEGQMRDDMHVGRTTFWFIPKATAGGCEAAPESPSKKRQRAQDTDSAASAEAPDAGSGSAQHASGGSEDGAAVAEGK